MSYEQFPSQESTGYGSAPTLVKLAGIFTLVAAGIDLLYGLLLVVLAILMGTGVIPRAVFENLASVGGAFGGGGGAPPPIGLIISIMSVYAFLSLGVCIVKLIGGMKLLRRSPGAWGWGLAAGIVGCIQLWCSLGCILPMAAGIFTIVCMCLETVRRYLRDASARA